MNVQDQKQINQNGTGPAIGSIIVIIVVLVGGIYFWGTKMAKNKETSETENQAMSVSAEIDLSGDINIDYTDDSDKKLDSLDKEIGNLEQKSSL